MKGLLLKDFYVLTKQLRYLLCLLILFCLLPGLSATAFSMLYVIMLPVNALAYDERCKWDRLAATMPYTCRSLVFSKYVLGYIGAFGVLLLSSAAHLLETLIARKSFVLLDFYVLLMAVCITLLMQAINLPMIIRFGVEKGRMIYILTLGLLSASVYLLQEYLPILLEKLPLEPTFLSMFFVLLTILINLISVRIAIRSYQKQEH